MQRLQRQRGERVSRALPLQVSVVLFNHAHAGAAHLRDRHKVKAARHQIGDRRMAQCVRSCTSRQTSSPYRILDRPLLCVFVPSLAVSACAQWRGG